ncbi:hypothetical protein ACQ5SO_17790 [Rhodovulum sp. DZ06]|uniref:hypothetical protein n=1 Tax=Rhodovulum sp. DZ06 TaxID=3425126 RepID=UPI003D34C516
MTCFPDRRDALGLLIGAGASVLLPSAAFALQRRLDFPPGGGRLTETATLRGRDEARFAFDGAAGAELTARVRIRGADARFNIWAPETRRAMFIGARSPDPYRFSGTLPKTGTYELQIFLVGAAARGDQDIPFSVEVDLKAPRLG